MRGVIEKYSLWIGIALVIISLVGGILLMVKKGASASNVDQNLLVEEKEKKISELENELSNLKKENEDLKASQSQNEQSSVTSEQVSGKININTASAGELDSLPGIGPAYAGRIIEYRQSHGGFKTLEEVMNVKGIGQKTFEKFRDQITI